MDRPVFTKQKCVYEYLYEGELGCLELRLDVPVLPGQQQQRLIDGLISLEMCLFYCDFVAEN